MKKIFTLFAAVLMAGSMMAENPNLIKFTEPAAAGSLNGQTFGSEFTLTITDTGNKVSIDANNATFGLSAEENVSFTYRLKTGGKSSSANKMTLVVPEEGMLVVYARTATSSATDRSFFITNGSDTIVKHLCLDTDTVEGASSKIFLPVIVENVPAGIYEVTYSAAINFYGFDMPAEEEEETLVGELLCTLDFPSHNDKEIGDYTSTWTATVDGATWTLTNFNNNKNVWNLVKCGRRGVASVASIETPALKATVNTLIYDFAALPANSVDSAFIYALYQGEEQGKAPVTLKAGKDTIATPVAGVKYSYKLEIYCKSASGNGPVQLSRVQVYGTPAQSAVADPTFSLAAGDFYDAQKVALACATEGAQIYYTLDGSEPGPENSTLYTDSIVISTTTTVKAIAIKNNDGSDVVEKTYTIAPVYASLTELVNAGAPAGQKVVVTLTNETIDSLYVSSGNKTNGVYLTAGGRMVEIFCYNVPAEWEVGGTISGTVKGEWKEWNGTWEVCPSSWEGITYAAPAPTAINAVATERKAVKVIENGQIVIIRDGKKFNAVGAKL